jgi:hypothetical protein
MLAQLADDSAACRKAFPSLQKCSHPTTKAPHCGAFERDFIQMPEIYFAAAGVLGAGLGAGLGAAAAVGWAGGAGTPDFTL